MLELNHEHLKIINMLTAADIDNDLPYFNLCLNIGIKYGFDELKRKLSQKPFGSEMPNMKGKNVLFANGTSAYVIDHFKLGSKNLLQVASSDEGDLIEFDSRGYPSNYNYRIMEVTEYNSVEDFMVKVNPGDCLGLTDFSENK